jgi:CheY-like chemotaxis protein
LRFEVTDTGIGIPADRIDQLFKRFSQVDASTTRKYGGSGLGLAICKQLAELMHGSVGVRSELGRGSTFWFTAEVTSSEPAPVPAVKSETAAKPITTDTERFGLGHTPKILLVEDNEINRLVAGQFLQQAGYAFDIAEDGVQAVSAVLRAAYDMVLMDCQMPRMDGYEATRRIRHAEKAGTPVISNPRREGVSCRRLPIVALTANAMKGDRQVCLDAGFDDYLTKPLDRQHLVKTLEFWLNVKQDEPSQTAPVTATPQSTASQSAPAEPAPMDLETLLRQVGGDSSFLIELARRFDTQSSADLQRIEQAIAGQDANALRTAAHRLKGTTGSIIAAKAHAISQQLEQLAIAGTLDGAEELLGQVRAEVDRCARHMVEYKAQNQITTR